MTDRAHCDICGQTLAWHKITLERRQIVARCQDGTQTRSFAKADVTAIARMVGIDTRKATY